MEINVGVSGESRKGKRSTHIILFHNNNLFLRVQIIYLLHVFQLYKYRVRDYYTNVSISD